MSRHERQLFESILDRAMEHAVRYVAWDQALEIAHDVASDLVRRGVEQPGGALIYRAVCFRLRNHWRANSRRAGAERVYHDERTDRTAEPSRELEARELRALIAAAIAAMPEGMRRVFTLVRHDERSYRDVAALLGIRVGTVHTQLSRATALLRQVVEDYERDGAVPRTLTGKRA
jgi:RNA polymerase sigma factor (sigma-70 family)